MLHFHPQKPGGLAGWAYELKGENDRAIEDYDQALRLDPEFAKAVHDRGGI